MSKKPAGWREAHALRQAQRERIWLRDEGRCGICGQPVPFQYMHLDHIVPRAAGGSDEDSNLQPSHPRCNMSAGKKGYPTIVRRILPPTKPKKERAREKRTRKRRTVRAVLRDAFVAWTTPHNYASRDTTIAQWLLILLGLASRTHPFRRRHGQRPW